MVCYELNTLGQKHIKENLRKGLSLENNWRSNCCKNTEANMKLHRQNKAKNEPVIICQTYFLKEEATSI